MGRLSSLPQFAGENCGNFCGDRLPLTLDRTSHTIPLMSYFRHLATIPEYKNAYALILSKLDVKTAVIFVHGFFGDSKKTWLSFQTIADQFSDRFPWWGNSDMFFFDYDDVTGSIDLTSRDFVKFMRFIYPKPDTRIFGADLSEWASLLQLHLNIPVVRLRDNFPGYSNLILVGHSEGAVVIRHAIERVVTKCVGEPPKTFTKPPEFPIRGGGTLKLPTQHVTQGKISELPAPSASSYPELEAEVCLFAPALIGASPSGFLGILAKKIHLLHFSRAYNDLQVESQVIIKLREHTEDYAKQYPQIPALKARILWGKDEEIVALDHYQLDTEEDPEPGRNHTSICKPRPDYTRPLEFVHYGTSS
jgi:hypothetical protein